MNKQLLAAAFFLLLLAACEKENSPVNQPLPETTQVDLSEAGEPGVALVKFDDSALDLLSAGTIPGDWGVASAERLFPDGGNAEPRMRAAGLHRWYKVTFDDTRPATKATADARELPGAVVVRPRLRIRKTSIPFNDPINAQPAYYQWYLDNSRSTWADINVLPLWEQGITGSPDVIVAVVDDGVDLEHEDLKANVIPGKEGGSYNFLYSQRGPGSIPGDHGTNVAGIIAAVNNNGIGFCGIAGGNAAKGQAGTRILGCQVLGEKGGGDAEAAIVYAANNGAVICNNSWGYDFTDEETGKIDEERAQAAHDYFLQPNEGEYADALKDAIDYFNTYAGIDPKTGTQTGPMAGGLVLFAAGNDACGYGAPASYPGVLAVGSTGRDGTPSYFTNYGDWVDICAPGGDNSNFIWGLASSQSEFEGYGGMVGTSQACPMVAGVAALIVSVAGEEGFTREKLINRLLGGGNTTDFQSVSTLGPYLNALGAYESDETAQAVPVGDISASANSNTLHVKWNVWANKKGKMDYGYRMILSEKESALTGIDPADPGTLYFMDIPNGTAVAGDKLEAVIKDLSFNTTYYACVAGYTPARKYSPVSAIVKVKTGSNHAPVIDAAFDLPITLHSFESVSIPVEIHDPDEFHTVKFDYTAGSYAEEIQWGDGTAASMVFTLKISGNKADAGSYTAQLSATDNYGLSTKREIPYTILPNQAPVVAKDFDNIVMHAPGETASFRLEDYIYDPDGEQLVYDINLFNPSTASMTQNGGTMQVEAKAYGMTKVTLSTADACGEKASGTFGILVRPADQPLSVYPNPVTTTLTVGTGETSSTAEIRVYSQTGALVAQASGEYSAFDPAEIDMSRMAPGRYQLRVTYGGQEYTREIVKK